MSAASHTDVTETTILRLADSLSLQPLGEDEGGVLLNLTSGEMYTVNDTALEFLNRLDGKRSVDAIVGDLLEMFEVDRATLLSDVAEIAIELKGAGLLVHA